MLNFLKKKTVLLRDRKKRISRDGATIPGSVQEGRGTPLSGSGGVPPVFSGGDTLLFCLGGTRWSCLWGHPQPRPGLGGTPVSHGIVGNVTMYYGKGTLLLLTDRHL